MGVKVIPARRVGVKVTQQWGVGVKVIPGRKYAVAQLAASEIHEDTAAVVAFCKMVKEFVMIPFSQIPQESMVYCGEGR
ncbi:hypothetical protein O3P69_006644 [Scylla paramamosain]|uniref:Uncharacterized protein n=1 Tax=Scylla paramamosain TaxID=85552 RepID=A0AAW0U0C7_SCYPA